MKILVVDDSRAMRSIMRRTLRQAGYGDHEVTEACTGAEALAVVQATPPGLVLSDWNMPEMSGLELLEAMRKAGNNTLFGFVTSETTPEMRARATEAGAAFLLAKPIDAESLQLALNPLLGAGAPS